MNDQDRSAWTLVKALMVMVGVPVVGSIAVILFVGPIVGLVTLLVLLAVSMSLMPAYVARQNAPGWPEFRKTFGDHPLWWLGVGAPRR